MRYYPINLDIKNKSCLVIGAGAVALRKVASLLKAGGAVHVVSPEAAGELEALASRGVLTWTKRKFRAGDLDGAALVIAATGLKEVDRLVCREAARLNLPVNVVDEPSMCTFTLPSYFERGDLMITISTGGKCPALSKHLRIKLENVIDNAYGDLLDILDGARQKLLTAGIDSDRCKIVLNQIISSDTLTQIREGKVDKARQKADKLVAASCGERT